MLGKRKATFEDDNIQHRRWKRLQTHLQVITDILYTLQADVAVALNLPSLRLHRIVVDLLSDDEDNGDAANAVSESDSSAIESSGESSLSDSVSDSASDSVSEGATTESVGDESESANDQSSSD